MMCLILPIISLHSLISSIWDTDVGSRLNSFGRRDSHDLTAIEFINSHDSGLVLTGASMSSFFTLSCMCSSSSSAYLNVDVVFMCQMMVQFVFGRIIRITRPNW